jgi:hypothetical protein
MEGGDDPWRPKPPPMAIPGRISGVPTSQSLGQAPWDARFSPLAPDGGHGIDFTVHRPDPSPRSLLARPVIAPPKPPPFGGALAADFGRSRRAV